MINQYLDEVQERCEKATEGPWKNSDGVLEMGSMILAMPYGHPIQNAAKVYANVDFAAHSRQDIPTLLKMLRRAMEFANDYGLSCERCRCVAKEALSDIEGMVKEVEDE